MIRRRHRLRGMYRDWMCYWVSQMCNEFNRLTKAWEFMQGIDMRRGIRYSAVSFHIALN